MAENQKKLVSFTPRMIEMLQALKDKRGFMSDPEVVRCAISEMYGRTFPAYSSTPRKRLTPEQQVQEDEQKKVAQQKRTTGEKRSICMRLAGKFKENDNDNVMCHYYTYSLKKRYKQEVSIEMLNEDMIKTQYQPSKTKVLALQAAHKVDYKVKK